MIRREGRLANSLRPEGILDEGLGIVASERPGCDICEMLVGIGELERHHACSQLVFARLCLNADEDGGLRTR